MNSSQPHSPQPKPGPLRVLFLTDSIHSRFPTHIFPNEVVCVRKINFQLCDIEKFKDMFHRVDLVFVSCGINDLSRYEKSGQYLADFICEKLTEFTRLYPDTFFVFNSILNTDYEWLIDDIEFVNERVFLHSVHLENLWFFDSHHVFNGVNFDVIDRAHGIHITHMAKRHVTPIIRTCLLDLLTGSPLTPSHWPLRPHFRHISHTH